MNLKINLKRFAIVIVSTFIMTSCATYHITTTSLLEQLAKSQPEKKINHIVAFTIAAPFFFPVVVTGNSLTEIKVLDKNERECIIPVSRLTGVRITKKDGTRKTFYFDTLLVKDSTITGKNDHVFGVNITPINLNNINKIELQNR
jgi:hypothetical protein